MITVRTPSSDAGRCNVFLAALITSGLQRFAASSDDTGSGVTHTEKINVAVNKKTNASKKPTSNFHLGVVRIIFFFIKRPYINAPKNILPNIGAFSALFKPFNIFFTYFSGISAKFFRSAKEMRENTGNLSKNNCLFSITGVYYIPVLIRRHFFRLIF